jgi:hypothetical protein
MASRELLINSAFIENEQPETGFQLPDKPFETSIGYHDFGTTQ